MGAEQAEKNKRSTRGAQESSAGAAWERLAGCRGKTPGAAGRSYNELKGSNEFHWGPCRRQPGQHPKQR